MLEGLDAVDWSGLTHAYGAATDLPGLLRQAAGESAEEAEEALHELYGCIMHSGTVYPATAAAVPFLVELARSAPTHREEFAYFVGMLADERHAYGAALPQVRAAVAARARDLESLLADPDPGVRASAAYAVAQADGAADPLWTRWAAENDPVARASVLLALARRDPKRAAATAARAVVEGAPPVRVAAGLTLVRLRRPWPDGAVAAVVAALGDGARLPYPWVDEPVRELMVDADDELAQGLLAALVTAPQARLRRRACGG